MMTIWKLELKTGHGIQILSKALPREAQILGAAFQDHEPVVWFQVDDTNELADAHFFVAETGKGLPRDLSRSEHIASIRHEHGYVLHIFAYYRRANDEN